MQTYLPRHHRVYLLDDHDIVRRGLRDLLAPAKDIHVVGDTGSAQQAVSDILQLDADIMLLDLHLQDGSGIGVCRAVRSVKPSVRGLLLTSSGDEEALAAAVLAGASGYLVKLTRSSDITGTIRKLRSGTSLLDADSVRRATRLLNATMDSLTPAATEQERRILEHIIDGQTDSQIGKSLGPGPQVAADTTPLVERLTWALLGEETRPSQPGAGRPRRHD